MNLIEISNCARCGKTHRVEPYQFRRPVEINNETFWHYANCPETNQPVLIKMITDNV